MSKTYHTIIEHNNRQKAKQFAEYITGKALRQYLADKVHRYAGNHPSVFDGAVGSGQLEQYINAKHIIGVDIQSDSIQAFMKNYSNATAYCQSFFEFDMSDKVDCVVMNPPFSIKFKDLSNSEKANIQNEFHFKKSGVVDDIFVLKAMKYAKRFGFFILFLGVGYRNTEKHFRDLISNQIVELNVICNAFDDTSIDVMFLVLDKEKITNTCHRERYDCKTKTIVNQDTWTIDSDCWQYIQALEQPKEKIDPIALEMMAREQAWQRIKNEIIFSKAILEFEPDLKNSFNDWLDDICHQIQRQKVA